ncbi:23267_t:CDS:2 [Gigaspora rosea]|nr:23267_t:CDS:2 [Gigaspora rosea]
MDDIDWNSFIAFSNDSDLEEINCLFSLPYSKDMNPLPPSGYEDNSQVNRSLFLPLTESNNNCLPTYIHGNNTSFNDHNGDFDNISLLYSKSSNVFFSPLSESNNNCLPISIQENNGDDILVDNTSVNEHDSNFDCPETSIFSNNNYGDLNTLGY